MLEFDDVLFHIESSRICRIDRPRWSIIGTEGGFVKFGIDPQEDALRAGDIDRAAESPGHQATLRRSGSDGQTVEAPYPTVRGHWDSYYHNIAEDPPRQVAPGRDRRTSSRGPSASRRPSGRPTTRCRRGLVGPDDDRSPAGSTNPEK